MMMATQRQKIVHYTHTYVTRPAVVFPSPSHTNVAAQHLTLASRVGSHKQTAITFTFLSPWETQWGKKTANGDQKNQK